MSNKAYWLATVFCVLAASPQAFAEESAQNDATVSELIVTSQRRVQNTLDVPIAITAYSGETLANLGVEDLNELSAFTPGLLIQNKSPIDARFIMRGIGSDDGSSYQEPRVSVFLDGAPISKTRGAYVALFDIERVEVARGPQTTLFGQGALIGAVNIVQQKARLDGFDWRLGAEGGDYGQRMVTGAVNAPLGETFAIRLAGQYRARDGYVENLLGGEDFGAFEVGAARLSLAWKPTSKWSTDLVVNQQHDEGSAQAYKSLTFFPANPTTGAVLGGLDLTSGAALAAGPGFRMPLGYERDMTGVSSTTVFEPSDNLSFTSTTAWRRYEGQQALDYDGFAFPFLTVGDDTVGEFLNQELRMNFKPTSAFDIVAGVTASREQGRQRTPYQIDERLVLALQTGVLDRTNPVLAPLASYTNPNVVAAQLQALATARGFVLSTPQALAIAGNMRGNHEETYTDSSKNKSFDAFTDVSWELSDRFRVLAGARVAISEKTSSLSASLPSGRSILAGYFAAIGRTGATRTALLNALAAPNAVTAAGPVPLVGLRVQPTANNGQTESDGLTDTGASYRLAAHYKVSDDASVYASYSRGRRPKVLSPNIPSAPGRAVVFDEVSAETVDSYEVGAKWRTPDRRLAFEAAVYYYDYNHFQTIIQQGVQFITTDAGRATSIGLETQTTWFLTEKTEVFANYAYSHARFREGLYKGNHLALSPDNALTLGVDAKWSVAGGTLRVLPTYRYTSKVFFADDNANPALVKNAFVTPINFSGSQKGYGIADLRVDYSPDGKRWTAGAFANNLFDKVYVKESGNGGESFGLPTYIPGDPRMVGVSFRIQR